LKQDPETRHIPVQIMTIEEERLQGLDTAFSYLIKPLTMEELKALTVLCYAQSHHRRLLIVEDNEIERQSIVELLGHEGVDIVTAGRNYGWRVYEGTNCTKLDPTLCIPANYIAPIAQMSTK
jgi:CheY-like chemotaxis protein